MAKKTPAGLEPIGLTAPPLAPDKPFQSPMTVQRIGGSGEPRQSVLDMGGWERIAPPAAEAESVDQPKGSLGGDLWSAFGIGSNSLVKMAGDFYALLGGARDNALSEAGRSGVEYWQGKKSDELVKLERRRKQAVDEAPDEIGKLWAFIRETISNPRLFSTTATEQVPMFVGSGVGGIGARMAAQRVLKGTAKEVAKRSAKAGVAGDVGAGAVMQGSDVGGDQLESLSEDLRKMPAEQAEAIPEIKTLRERGATLDEAKAVYALTQARKTGALAAAISLGSQALPGAREIERVLTRGRLGGGRVGSRLVGGAVGGVGEPVGESIEEGGGRAAMNLFAQGVDPGRPLTQGVGESVGQAIVGAGPIGGVAGALNAEPRRPVAGDLPPDIPGAVLGGETGPGAPEAPTGPSSSAPNGQPPRLENIERPEQEVVGPDLPRLPEGRPTPQLPPPGPEGSAVVVDAEGNAIPASAEQMRQFTQPARDAAEQQAEEQRRRAELGLTPDIERAQANRTPFEVVDVGPNDIVSFTGRPFLTRKIAESVAGREGGTVVPVPGGFAVRRAAATAAQPPAAPAAAPEVPAPGAQSPVDEAPTVEPAAPNVDQPAEAAGEPPVAAGEGQEANTRLLDARNTLIELRSQAEQQGAVVDDRLLERIRRQEKLVRELEAEAAGEPPAAPVEGPGTTNTSRYWRPEGERRPYEELPSAKEKASSDKEFAAVIKALGWAVDSGAGGGFLQGWMDAERGLPPDPTKIAATRDDARGPGFFNPVDPYSSGYVSQQAGRAVEIREWDNRFMPPAMMDPAERSEWVGGIEKDRTDADTVGGFSLLEKVVKDVNPDLLLRYNFDTQEVSLWSYVTKKEERLAVVKTDGQKLTDDQVSTIVVAAEAAPKKKGGVAGEVKKLKDAESKKAAAFVEAVAQRFREGKGFGSIVEARALYEQVTGRKAEGIHQKMADELVESAIVLRAREIVAAGRDPKETFDALVRLYGYQPNLGTRTSTSVEQQAYSTPAPLAYLSGMLAGAPSAKSGYEPTAGRGLLTISAPPGIWVVNELNSARRSSLEDQGFAQVTGKNAAEWVPEGGNFDVIGMNPPFGVVKDEDGQSVKFKLDVGGGTVIETGEVDHAIAWKALKKLKDDGKAFLIVGSIAKTVTGDKARGDAYNSSAKRRFYYYLYQNYNVVDHFTVIGDLYSKQGAAWPVDVILIDGKGKSALRLPSVNPPRIYKSWDELKGLLDASRLDANTQGPVRRPDGNQGGQGSGAVDGGLSGVPRPADTGAGGQGQKPAGGGRPVRGGSGGGGGGAGGNAGAGQANAGGGAGAVGAGASGPPAAPGSAPGSVKAPGAGKPGGGGAGAATGSDAGSAGTPPNDSDAPAGLDDIFNEELGALFGDEPAPQPSPAPQPQSTPPRTPAEAAASAAANAAAGLDNIAAGLGALFGGKQGGRLGSGPTFDEKTYEQAKPFFIAAAEYFKKAAADVRELMRMLLTTLKEKYNFTREALVAMQPYVVRFVSDVTGGKIKLGAKPSEKRDLGTNAGQLEYVPGSKLEALGTLVPTNQKSSVEEAIASLDREVGGIDEFVRKELGYKTLGALGDAFAAEQIDALALAIDQMKRGSGFIIGDQTGIGKGRVVAGVIRWSLKNGKAPIFVTEKPNLYGDIIRDLNDIGMKNIRPLMTNSGASIPLDTAASDWLADFNDQEAAAEAAGQPKPKKPPVSARPGNWLKTPTKASHDRALTEILSKGADLKSLQDAGYDVVFTTYTQMDRERVKINNKPTGSYIEDVRHRFIREVTKAGATLMLDETHNAGGGKTERPARGGRDSGGGQAVEGRGALFRELVGDAGAVFYSSATYAKRPDVMDLYFRTDMRKAVGGNVSALPNAIQAGGVPLQQVVSSMLVKARQYIRRERTFNGVEYRTDSVDVDRKAAENISSTFSLIDQFDQLKQAAVDAIDDAIKDDGGHLAGGDAAIGQAGATSTNFTSLMHNVVNQMLLSLKVKQTVDYAVAALKAGEKPVITLANTMGSFIESYADAFDIKPGDAIGLSFRDVLMRYLFRSREVTIKNPDGTRKKHYLTDEELGPVALAKFKEAEAFIRDAENIGDLPISPIDHLHNELRKAGYKTGEITGRAHTIDYSQRMPRYVVRGDNERNAGFRRVLVDRFNSGALDVMILNQSGSTGLSLHASEKFKDKKKRHMIILQPELNIDTHMQMLGRVHRTGQVVTPRFTQLVANVPAEIRPASILAKKMASLSANTTANRKSALSASDVPDFMNEYGDQVAAALMRDMPEIHQKIGEPLPHDGAGFDDTNAMAKVTGRLPMLPIAQQEEVYDLLTQNYNDLIAEKDALGENALEAKTYDLEARTVDTRTMFEGEKEDASPFAAGAYAEVVDVKRLGKPYTSAQVFDMASANIKKAAPNLSQAVDDVSLYTSGKFGRLAALGRRAVGQLRSKVSDEFTAYKNEVLLSMSNPEAIRATQTRLDAAFNHFNRMTDTIHIGGQYRLILADGSPTVGVAINLERKRGIKLPVAPGAWVVDFALADASRHVKVPFSRLITGNDPGMRGGMQVMPATHDPITGESIEKSFDIGQRTVRENRVMLTGNLLAAFSRLPKGQIINYTNADGAIQQGILLARGTDINKLGGELPILLTPKQAFDFLQRVAGAKVETEDGGLAIFVDRMLDANNDMQLRARQSKADGGRYYLSPKIRAITGDWVSRGGSMRVDVPFNKAASVLEEIGKIGQIITNMAKSTAIQFGGSPFRPKTDEASKGGTVESRARLSMPRGGMSVPDVQTIVDGFVEKFPGAKALNITVVPHVSEIPEPYRPSIYAAGGYHADSGNVYLVAWNIENGQVAQETLLHEVVGHYGVEVLLGKDFDRVLDRVQEIAHAKGEATGNEVPGDANYATMESVAARYKNSDSRTHAREVLARMAETDSRPTLIEALYMKIRAALRKLGINLKLTNAELRQIVIEAGNRLRQGTPGTPGGGLPLFKLNPPKGWEVSKDTDGSFYVYGKDGSLKSHGHKSREAAAKAAWKASDEKPAPGVMESRRPPIRDQVRSAEAKMQERQSLRERAGRVLRRFEEMVEPLMTLPQRAEFLKERYLALGKIAKAEDMAKLVIDVFRDASDASKQQAYDYLTTAGAEASRIADQKVRDRAVWAKNQINAIGDQLVARGLLAEDARETYRDAYLPRLYLKHLLNQDDWIALSTGKKPSNMGYLKNRRDIPEETRRIILGEITDPGFLAAHAIAKPLRDMALLDWLETISHNEVWVLPRSFVRWRGRKVSAAWLASEAERIRRQSDFYTPDNKRAALDLAEEMDSLAREALNMPEDDSITGYKQLPNTPRYGRMRGIWVREEIYDDVVGVQNFVPADQTAWGSLFGYGGIGTRITQWWKLGKVALNVPSQIRNWTSNAILLQLSGVPMTRVPDRIFQAWREVVNDGRYYQIAKKYGVTEATFNSNELAKVNQDLLEIERKMGELTVWGRLQLAISPITDWAGDIYQMAEALFKTAKIIDAMEREGLSEGDAALEAHKWLFDYSLVSSQVRFARNAPIGMPFLTFTVKVLPRLLEVAAKHPQRFLPWAGLFYSIPLLVSMMTGVDDEDLDKLQLSLPKRLQERGHLALLPWRDADGRWQVIDLGYFMPWSFYTDMIPVSMRTARATFSGDLERAKQSLGDDWSNTQILSKAMGLLGGPIPDVLNAARTNIDPFTEREIVPENAPEARRNLLRLNYFYDLMMPPMITSRGFVSPMWMFDRELGGKLPQAIYGDTNRAGEPRATGLQAGLYLGGVNLYGIDPNITRSGNLARMRAEIQEAQRLMVQRLSNKSLSAEERAGIIQQHREHLADKMRKMSDYATRSAVPEEMRTRRATAE